jgi:hypothetical protein
MGKEDERPTKRPWIHRGEDERENQQECFQEDRDLRPRDNKVKVGRSKRVIAGLLAGMSVVGSIKRGDMGAARKTSEEPSGKGEISPIRVVWMISGTQANNQLMRIHEGFTKVVIVLLS